MRIAIVTDAWHPQVNGVVRTLDTTVQVLRDRGHDVLVVGPSEFRTIPLPTYREIPVALLPGRALARRLDEFLPEAIHIATEASLGLAARRYCLRRGLAFSSAYHTQFPEYVRLRAPIPLAWSYAYLRWFHRRAACTMVATPSLEETLRERGFDNLVTWSRGVHTDLFRPRDKSALELERPVFLYVGRVAVEKNIEAFLQMQLPGSKVVIGDGPAMQELRGRHPEAAFTGYKSGEDLARHIAAADVMVFPSLTDTFGLVIIEANACGVPVAAFPVTGPKDLIDNGRNGWIDDDLQTAALAALEVDPASCRSFAEHYSWAACTDQFLSHLQPLARGPVGVPGEETA